MVNNFTPIGSELQINLAPNQNLDQFDPDVAVLTDGRFFVAFSDMSSLIIGQFVNPDGTVSGSNIDIEIDAGDQDSPAVAQRAAGAAVVVWHDDTSSDEIHYAIVSGAGAVGTEQTLLDGNDFFRLDVATVADGRSWAVATQNNGGNLDIRFRFIDALGVAAGPVGGAFIDNGTNRQDDVAVAAFGNNALVVYEEEVTAITNQDIQARFFDGSNFATEVTIADTAGFLESPDVAALTDGRFIVVFVNGDNKDVEGRFVSAGGVPLGTAFTISGFSSDGIAEDPRVAGLPDGGFIVTWDTDDPDIGSEVAVPQRAVLAQRFDANGAPAGELFLVNTGDPLTDQELPAIAANPTTGQAFITWEDNHAFTGAGEDADPFSVRGHAFLATTDVVNGTEGNDQITSFSLSEPINGLGGDNSINGLAGDDIIHGGAGFDQIAGGAGNDQLFGEGGEDLLKGEDGDDLLVGGLGRDVQLGGAGRDTFDFNANNESHLGANHDFVKGFSHAQHDKIDLQTIDADTTAGGNQAFDFIGGAGFSGAAGELRLSGGLLLGDTNGNGVADFEIKVTGIGAGAAGDFVL